jgi:hypothetical protein
MNLESRKIDFVQQFLRIDSEEAIGQLEKVLKKVKSSFEEKEIKPMTLDEFHKRINQSELDIKNGRFKTSAELLTKYK